MRRLLPLSLLLAAALVPAGAHAAVRKGPAGLAFYKPPAHLPGGTHGRLIWARRTSARSWLVLYRSVGLNGKVDAVSGVVSVPKGRAPKGGWPVISYAHGTTGIADGCAPSRAPSTAAYVKPLLDRWLKAGYAVATTDYDGLGTPGIHPYLIGAPEGHDVLDIVRAARGLGVSVGPRVILSGHSQGGQAALYAAALASKWTPELTIRGTVAFAPVTHLAAQLPLTRSITTPSGITGLAAMIIRGIGLGDPSLHVESLLTPQAAALFPQVDTRCLDDLDKPDSFGGMAPSQLLRSDADLNPLATALHRLEDAETLTIKTPLRIEQGSADTTVFPAFTDQTVQEYSKRGTPLVYKKYDGVTHGGIVVAAAGDATSWIRQRLK